MPGRVQKNVTGFFSVLAEWDKAEEDGLNQAEEVKVGIDAA